MPMEIPTPSAAAVDPAPAIAAIAQPSRGVASWGNRHGAGNVRPAEPNDPDKLDMVFTGEKHSSKTCSLVGIPINKGKRHFLAFDKRTKEGLVRYYGKGILKDNVVYPLITEDGDYPGFDPNKPWTAEVVFGQTMRVLETIEEKGDGDVIVLEHLQYAYEKIARSLIVQNHGLDPASGSIERQWWSDRAVVMDLLVAKARAISNMATVFTGYSEEEKDVVVEKTIEEIEAEKRAKGRQSVGKTKWVRKIVTPKWVTYVNRDQSCWLHSSLGKETEGDGADKKTETRYWVETMVTSNAKFPKDGVFELTNTNLRIFWEEPAPEALAKARVVEELDREMRLKALAEPLVRQVA